MRRIRFLPGNYFLFAVTWSTRVKICQGGASVFQSCCDERRAALPGLAERVFSFSCGGQRQQITLPMGGGNPRQGQKYDGYLDYVLTQKFCIGSTDGSPSNNKDVFSNKCYNTKYTVEYLSNQY